MKIKMFRHIDLLFLLKVSIGTAAAIIIADQFGLLYSPSAGIITLLTIQNTKKETLLVALRRFIAFAIAVTISYLIFQGIGYTAVAFGGFILLFVALCLLFSFKDAIAMNAVLMTHFLIEQRMDVALILNELGLLWVGMLLGILLNLIMPSKKMEIRKQQVLFEEDMKGALRTLSNLLKNKESCLIQERERDYSVQMQQEQIKQKQVQQDQVQQKQVEQKQVEQEQTEREQVLREKSATVDFLQLELRLEALLQNAYEEAGNTLLNDTKYLIAYLEMRKLQLEVLKDVKSKIEEIPVLLKQTYPITAFIDQIAESYHELNNLEGLLFAMDQLKDNYRKEELPKNREEFEYRAALFQILKELEYFLWIKRNFILEIERKNIKYYWEDKK